MFDEFWGSEWFVKVFMLQEAMIFFLDAPTFCSGDLRGFESS